MTTTSNSESNTGLPEVAFYYPGWIWYSDAAIKNLLLFFDGIALLVPDFMRDRPANAVPEIVVPLVDDGLLHILEPEKLIDKRATERLAEAMTDIIASGSLDSLANEGTGFRELSYSRLGGAGDAELARMIHEELKVRGLAQDTRDGLTVPIHPLVHSLVLVLHAQILKPNGMAQGLALEPTTDRPELVRALTEILSLRPHASVGDVVATDLRTVGVDLSHVPLDEILSFRNEHGSQYRAYRRAVKDFVRDLSRLPPAEREAALDERVEEIEDLAGDVARRSQQAWKRPVSVALGVVGAAASAWSGNPIGFLLALRELLTQPSGAQSTETGTYSYLFRAKTY